MSMLGAAERLIGQLSPYRGVVLLLGALAVAALVLVGRWRGWGRSIGRHPRASAAVAVAALVLLVPVGYVLLSPLWTRSELVEAMPLATGAAAGAGAPVIAAGEFRGADAFHFGQGQAALVEVAPGRLLVRFEEFSVRNGPDLHVYLSPSAEGYTGDALHLGPLKATDGAFNYDVPAGTDPARSRSVVVWYRPFEVLFAIAPLDESLVVRR